MNSLVAEALLWLVRISPFFGVMVVVVRMKRAFTIGEVKAGGGKTRIRTVRRATSPVFFWIEMVLHVVAGLFLFLMGVLLTVGPHNTLVEPLARGFIELFGISR